MKIAVFAKAEKQYQDFLHTGVTGSLALQVPARA
jgi:hypothetical protein